MAEEEEEVVEYQIEYLDEEEETEPQKYVTKDGKAKVTYPNGDIFTGSFVNNLKNGEGSYVYNETKAKYCGMWKDGMKEGTGKFEYPDGSLYQGNWSENKRNGKGSYYFPNGDVYCGNWKDGIKHDFGTYIYSIDGSQLTGNWEMGKYREGEWSMGEGETVFEGKFNEDGQPAGKGSMSFQISNELKHVEHGCFNEGSWIAEKNLVTNNIEKLEN